jgi:outer membrane immunogenic protein
MRMRQIQALVAGLALAGGLLAVIKPGCAADLGGGYKDAVYAEAPKYWQGPYAGVALGVGGAGLSIRDAARDNPSVSGDSFTGGLLVGYNFRSGPWVGGFEADFSLMDADKTKHLDGYGDVNVNSNWYGSLRLRAGYAWDRVLIYATGGLGGAQWEMKSPISDKQSVGFIAPAFGAGVELALDPNWSMRAEALAVARGTATVDVAGAKEDVSFGTGTLRLGLTRRF